MSLCSSGSGTLLGARFVQPALRVESLHATRFSDGRSHCLASLQTHTVPPSRAGPPCVRACWAPCAESDSLAVTACLQCALRFRARGKLAWATKGKRGELVSASVASCIATA